jgi:hypothetical protein
MQRQVLEHADDLEDHGKKEVNCGESNTIWGLAAAGVTIVPLILLSPVAAPYYGVYTFLAAVTAIASTKATYGIYQIVDGNLSIKSARNERLQALKSETSNPTVTATSGTLFQSPPTTPSQELAQANPAYPNQNRL